MAATFQTGGPVSITYELEGSGPLIVFLHGIGGNRRNWALQLAHFGSRFCAVSWDARGYLDSDDSPEPTKFKDFADDLLRLLDHVGAERAHLVGLSMGGMIVQDFYDRYPARVASLCLADSSAGFGGVSDRVRDEFLSKRLEPLERGLTPRDIAPEVVKVLVAESASLHVREALIASMSALRTESYKQALKAIITTDFRSGLPNIAVPALVIVGDEDQVTPKAESDFLVSRIPDSKLVVIPGAGHLSNIEKPDLFNNALNTFLTPHAEKASLISSG